MPRYATFRFPKELIFNQIGYKTYDPAVDAFHASDARYRFVSAPNRASKSWAAGHDALGAVFPPMRVEVDEAGVPIPGAPIQPLREEFLIWIVAPDYGLCKEFDYLYKHLVENRKKYGWTYKVERGTTNNAKQGNMRITINWGETPDGNVAKTIIEGKSGANEKGLQSEEVHYCIMSEAADQDERIFAQYLFPRVKQMVVPTTPKIKAEWIRKHLEEGSIEGYGTEVFEFTPYANPKYDWTRFRIAALKAESLVAKTNIYKWDDNDRPLSLAPGTSCSEEEPHFAETFLGKWTYESERVLPFKWEPDYNGVCHVLNACPEWVWGARKMVSVDYGYTDPAAAGFWAVGEDGTKVLCAEIYETHLSATEFVAKIERMRLDLGWVVDYYVGDPSKPEVNGEFNKRRLPVYAMNKNVMRDREAGHMEFVDNLAVDPVVGHPMLYVLSEKAGHPYGCRKTIEEWKLLRRKSTSVNEFNTGAIEGNDHAYDHTRYFLQTKPTGRKGHTLLGELEEMRLENLRRERLRPAQLAGGMRGGVPRAYA